MSKGVLKNTLFPDAVLKNHGRSPSGGDCLYADTDLQGIPLVIGIKLGEDTDFLGEISKSKPVGTR